MLARCAPRNPEAWLTLGRAIDDSAERIRHSRVWTAMTDEEQEDVRKIYDAWVPPVRRATELDPRCGRAWQRLAVAATFAGEEKLAGDAIWTAARLDLDERSAVWWGALEMYSPKWPDDPEQFKRAAILAVQDHYDTTEDMLSVADSLRDYGLRDLATELHRRTWEAAYTRTEREPNNAAAQRALGDLCLALGDRPAEAKQAWEKAVELDGNGSVGRAARRQLAAHP